MTASGLILELFRYAAAPSSPDGADRVAGALENARQGELQWALDAGLGPLLYETTRSAPVPVPSALGEVLLSADLTARVLHGNRVEAAEAIVDACTGIGVPVTLLKGISISEQFYPSPHHRTMSDIDVLVPEDALAAVEAEAHRLGYRQQGPSVTGPGSHHGEPLYHPQRQVEIEIHTALFATDSPLNRGSLFSPASIACQSVVSTFRGRPIRRLSGELQLVYIASYWVRDLSGLSVHPSFVPPLLDMIEILGNRQHALDWEQLLRSLNNERAAASFYLVLSYLDRRDLAQLPAQLLPRLAACQGTVGFGELRTIHAVLDKFLVGGRPFYRPFSSSHIWKNLMEPRPYFVKLISLPWNIAFPPGPTDRYTIRRQMYRLARRFRGARQVDPGWFTKR